MFTHELAGALLALMSKIVISEMVAVEALINTAGTGLSMRYRGEIRAPNTGGRKR